MRTATNRRSRRLRLNLLAAACGLALLATGCIPGAGTVPHTSAPAPSGCVTDVGATAKVVVAGCGGDITYNVSVPARCLEFACGLIVDVHGWTMSGDIQERNTGIAAIGRDEGYIVVQPSAPGGSWNSSHYPYVAAFTELAIVAWRVDARRVHITGFSQGGAMTTWMRCNRTSLFASAAPTAIAGSACANGANMPTLYLQGTNDIFISQAAIDATINSYVTRYGYDRRLVLADADGNAHTAYGSSTDPSARFRTYIHHDTSFGVNGHCIMGSVTPEDPYGCDQAAPISHGRLVVDFFEAHPKQP